MRAGVGLIGDPVGCTSHSDNSYMPASHIHMPVVCWGSLSPCCQCCARLLPVSAGVQVLVALSFSDALWPPAVHGLLCGQQDSLPCVSAGLQDAAGGRP